MENAGRNAADVITLHLVGSSAGHVSHAGSSPVLSCEFVTSAVLSGRNVAVVAGKGNNGGDGFVIARHLMMRSATVTTFLAGFTDASSNDARENLSVLRNIGGDIRSLDCSNPEALEGFYVKLDEFDLIVDAIGGTGIRGGLKDDLAAVVAQVNRSRTPVIAIDIPSGLDCDTGQVHGECIRAVKTVTFAASKLGFSQNGALAYTGYVVVADIGVSVGTILKHTQK
jgi:NAD(P)H-hydrate epimerase